CARDLRTYRNSLDVW
nr:immunoglobulin heavy chain junction region [Macaca mulatta]